MGFRVVSASHEAKQLGINRDDTKHLVDALEICPWLICYQLPSRSDGKPDHTKKFSVTEEIGMVIRKCVGSFDIDYTLGHSPETDEFSLNITNIIDEIAQDNYGQLASSLHPQDFGPKTFIYNNKKKSKCERISHVLDRLQESENYCDSLDKMKMDEVYLLHGASIGYKIIREIRRYTGYYASIGAATNPMMAKIASGIHKPKSTTIVTPSGFLQFARVVNFRRVPGLGGKAGQCIEEYFKNVHTMADLQNLEEDDLIWAFSQAGLDNKVGRENRALKIMTAAHGIYATCY